MGRHTISHAAELFSGAAYKPAHQNALRGLPIDLLIEADLGTPILADTDRILDGEDATDSAQSYTTFLAQPDVPRNLTAVGSAGADHVVTITGTDAYDEVVVENLTLNGTTPIIGKKAFKTVTQVDVAVGAAGDTFDLGIGSAIGIPYRVDAGDLLMAIENNVALTANGGGAAAVTAIGVTFTWTANDPGVTDGAATIDDGATVGDDNDAGAALSAIEDQLNKLVADVAAIKAANEAGTFLAAVTTAATATTGDVRGTYTPVVTLDGSTPIKLVLRPAGRDTAEEAFGVAQFAG